MLFRSSREASCTHVFPHACLLALYEKPSLSALGVASGGHERRRSRRLPEIGRKQSCSRYTTIVNSSFLSSLNCSSVRILVCGPQFERYRWFPRSTQDIKDERTSSTTGESYLNVCASLRDSPVEWQHASGIQQNNLGLKT